MAKFMGNRRDRTEELAQPKQADFQCAYVSGGGLRCRELGAISDSTTGGGPWYCRDHSHERGTQFADQVAEFSYRHAPGKTPSWQDHLRQQRIRTLGLPERMSREEAIQKISGSVFGDVLLRQLSRKPGEDDEES